MITRFFSIAKRAAVVLGVVELVSSAWESATSLYDSLFVGEGSDLARQNMENSAESQLVASIILASGGYSALVDLHAVGGISTQTFVRGCLFAAAARPSTIVISSKSARDAFAETMATAPASAGEDGGGEKPAYVQPGYAELYPSLMIRTLEQLRLTDSY